MKYYCTLCLKQFSSYELLDKLWTYSKMYSNYLNFQCAMRCCDNAKPIEEDNLFCSYLITEEKPKHAKKQANKFHRQ